jgi:hypothetical protein
MNRTRQQNAASGCEPESLAMMLYHGYGRNQRRTAIQNRALKMQRNTEVRIEDGLDSRNISWPLCRIEVGNHTTIDGLECHNEKSV